VEAAALKDAAVVLKSLPPAVAEGLLAGLSADEAASLQAAMAKPGQSNSASRRAALERFAADVELERLSRDAEPRRLAEVLAAELPQTAAAVLSRISPRRAAETLGELPAELRADVVRRIALSNPPDNSLVRDLLSAVRRELSGSRRRQTSAGAAAMAKLLGAMPPDGQRRLLERLAATAPELFRAARLAMFGPDVVAAGEEYGALEAA